jgi:hypothetical protein
VPVERTRAEIEKLLRKHRCTQFIVGGDYEQHQAMVQFRAHNRIVRFFMKLPCVNGRLCTPFIPCCAWWLDPQSL